MLSKLSLPMLAALVLGLVAVIFAVAMAVMLVKGQAIPERLWGGAAALGAYLVGWISPPPKAVEAPKDGAS